MSAPTASPSDLPALWGGAPVRPEGPPEWPAEDAAVAAVLQQLARNGGWGRYQGPHCEQLVERLAAMHGAPHVHLCSSGTVAVELALRGLNVRHDDEVILAAYDFKANYVNVLTVGAVPVLADVRPDDGQLDVSRVAAAIGGRTRAILVSHLHGGVVEMPALRDTADRHGLPVIEDACQMPAANIYGRVAGTWGDVGVMSFGGSKLLTAGRGGALVTPRSDVAQRIRLYTQRGNDAYPLSEMQAAVLLPQLERLDADNARRRDNVARLVDLLRDLSGLSPFPASDAASPGYYKLGFWYDEAAFGGLSRDRFSEAMRAEGIALDPGFRGLHLIHSRRRFRSVDDLPNATRLDESVLTLHHPVLLCGDDDLQQIAFAARRIQRYHAR